MDPGAADANTEDGVDVAWANTDGVEANTDCVVEVAPNAAVAGVGVLNTDGLASLPNTEAAVLVPKTELVVVVAAEPKIEPGLDANTPEGFEVLNIDPD